MESGYTAIVKKDGGGWIGWVEEVPGANAQEKTREELLTALREALSDILELNFPMSLMDNDIDTCFSV